MSQERAEPVQSHAPAGTDGTGARRAAVQRVLDAFQQPDVARRAAYVAIPLLLVAALLLPPISIGRRIAARGHARVVQGEGVQITARGEESTILEISRRAAGRSSRISLWAQDALPRGVDPLPVGQAPISLAYRLDVRGPAPTEGRLSTNLPIGPDAQPFVDPYGWDGDRWRWLSPEFVSASRVRVIIPLEDFVPDPIVLTLARGGATEVSAVLLPPPARAPAAAAELPAVELRAYRLADDMGAVERRQYPPVPLDVRRSALVDDFDGTRVRDDLVTNLLIRPEARRAHREALVRLALEDGVDTLVIDYQGVPDDLYRALSDMVERLSQDLEEYGIDLVVVVPMPRFDGEEWDSGAVDWRAFGSNAAVRVRLPDDRPIEVSTLDSMVRWALQQVDRRRLQLALPVWGRDVLEDDVVRVGFGESLQRVLDMARSDTPRRLSPGEEMSVELPSIAASELGRDQATGMWRFAYWDDNRRRHTVWLNDAEGLAAAFEVAAHYRLGRLALDGVSASADPRVWSLVSTFLEHGEAEAPRIEYMLRWQLVDAEGRVVEEALQPIEDATFRFASPSAQGDYTLRVDLVTGDGALAAVGVPLAVSVAPAPPPSPTPTIVVLRILPTPESYSTAPPPSDELGITRTPVRVGGTIEAGDGTDAPVVDWDAEIDFAEAALRSAPDVSSERLSDLRRGDRMVILERDPEGEWYRVRIVATGLEGWVLARLVAEREPTPDITLEPESTSSALGTPTVRSASGIQSPSATASATPTRSVP